MYQLICDEQQHFKKQRRDSKVASRKRKSCLILQHFQTNISDANMLKKMTQWLFREESEGELFMAKLYISY